MDQQTFETPIRHQHADGTIHAHGGSDNRGLNEFLRKVGQIKAGEMRPDETLGDEPHSHDSIPFGGSESTDYKTTGPVIWSQRIAGIDLATFDAQAEKDEADSLRLDAIGYQKVLDGREHEGDQPALDRNDPEDRATMNAIRAGIGLPGDERPFKWNIEATGRLDACSICGKRIHSTAKKRPMIHYLTNGNITSALYHPESQGFFEIGSGCAKTLPAAFVHYFPAENTQQANFNQEVK